MEGEEFPSSVGGGVKRGSEMMELVSVAKKSRTEVMEFEPVSFFT
jgi:hypothetical protein